MSTPSINCPLANQVESAIRSIVGDGSVALHEPRFEGSEWSYLKECLDSTFVSSVGPFVNDFERALENITGASYAVAVVNGTAALHTALRVIGVMPGEEVLTPTLTFIATANAVSYCNAIPHFIDSETETLGVSPGSLRDHLKRISIQRDGNCINSHTGRVIRAIIAMHTFGHSVDLDGIIQVAAEFNISVVEDAAESLGSFYNNRHTGTFGKVGVLSFNGNKIITTGGGGAIITNDPILAAKAKYLTTTAKTPHPWNFQHDEIGYNYRMPNLNAALGCAQWKSWPSYYLRSGNFFQRYKDAFEGISGVSIFQEPLGAKSNYWLQTLVLDDSVINQKNLILSHLNNNGIMARPVWGLMHRQKPFLSSPRAPLEISESLEKRLINLPSSAFLTRG